MRIFYAMAGLLLRYFPPKEAESVREKQLMMHPGGSGSRLTRDYYMKKLSVAIAVMSAGVLLSFIILISDLFRPEDIEGYSIERNGYGEGDRAVSLDLYADGELLERGRQIIVSEKHYKEDDIQAAFLKTAQDLDEAILGENISPDHIDRDLVLPDRSADYPIDIEWLVGDRDVLDMNGHIQEDYRDPAGREVKLKAMMSYGETEAEHSLYVKVYPKYRTPEDTLSYEITRGISETDALSVSEDRQRLPSEAAGHELMYRYSLPHTWLYVLLISSLAAFAVYIGRDHDLSKEVAERERAMMLDYPEIVSKLTLLIGAGMTVRAAFEKIAVDYREQHREGISFAHEEMLVTLHRMKSGVSEPEAYLDFGKRCAVKRYVKLGALLAQNIRKGSAGMLPELEREVRDAFEERKAKARKSGEIASTKLLIPMALMLGVVMFIVIVPAFMSFNL